MKKNIAEVVKVLETEKCIIHKYRALVYLEKEAIKIIACCDSFKQHLEETSRKYMAAEMYELKNM